jgi:hypothetical protein
LSAGVPTGLTQVVDIAAGNGHTVALRADGTVRAWGNNTALQSSIPLNLGTVSQVAAGGNFSLAISTIATPPCPGDLNGDKLVDGSDLGILIGAWGSTSGGAGDFDGDGRITGLDLGALLGDWGRCMD